METSICICDNVDWQAKSESPVDWWLRHPIIYRVSQLIDGYYIPLFIGFHGKHPIIYRLSTAFNMFQPSQIGG